VFADSRGNRRSPRLHGYNYAENGAYFVTICTHNRASLFGEVVEGSAKLNPYGQVVDQCWHDLRLHYSGVELDEFVVMPNHVHGIVVITGGDVGEGLRPSPTKNKQHGLPELIRAFKSFSARKINELRGTSGTSVWQRSYYEHIIRNENSLAKVRQYIQLNPLNWELDKENPTSPLFGS
jgi:putative transposase